MANEGLHRNRFGILGDLVRLIRLIGVGIRFLLFWYINVAQIVIVVILKYLPLPLGKLGSNLRQGVTMAIFRMYLANLRDASFVTPSRFPFGIETN